jgi:hypothetical protein
MKLFSKLTKSKYFTLPKIHKAKAFLIPNAVESTPIIWQNRLCLVLFERPVSNCCVGSRVNVIDFFTKQTIFSYTWKYGLGCAIVVKDRLYVVGSTEWDKQNHLGMIHFDKDFVASPITKIWDAVPNQKLFNTSICEGPNGYIMAYETDEKGLANFNVRFAISKDLEHWTSIGTIFHPDIYCACPTIRYYNDYYYIIYLRSVGKYYIEFIARTKDFQHFEEFTGNATYGPEIQVLSSMDCPHEGINNSDIDLVEYHGLTIMVYADGDQRTWANIRTAVYLGKMGEFFEEFFPPINS